MFRYIPGESHSILHFECIDDTELVVDGIGRKRCLVTLSVLDRLPFLDNNASIIARSIPEQSWVAEL